MRNQCPHIEQMLLGVDARSKQAAGGDPIPTTQEQRYAHSGMFAPLFGCVLNQGDEDVTFRVQQSDNDNSGGSPDPYTDMNLRVGGAVVTSITVKAGARVVFSIEAFNQPTPQQAGTAPKAWIKAVAAAASGEPARSMKGVVTFAYFTGNLRQRTPVDG